MWIVNGCVDVCGWRLYNLIFFFFYKEILNVRRERLKIEGLINILIFIFVIIWYVLYVLNFLFKLLKKKIFILNY